MFNLEKIDLPKLLNYLFENILLFITILTIISFLVFLIFWKREPRRLINGWLFTIFFGIFLLWLAVLIFATKNNILIYTAGITFIVLLFLVLLALSFSWFFLLWNAYVVWKHESHNLPNLLTLLLGIGLVAVWFIGLFGWNKILPNWANYLISGAPVIMLYLGFVLFNFLVNLALYQVVSKRGHKDYLIVLGAGLIDGERVTKLLGNRIDRAINFANKQLAKSGELPKIIMSGGQGPDEKISEAQAMKNYALDQGFPAGKLLLEGKSVNTFQNMRFSKELAINDFGSERFKVMFVSNNYHIFRASLIAKKAGLNANGIGAKTRFYFLPNAIIREFAAVFMMHKKRHFIIIGTITLLAVFSSVMSFFII